MACARAGKTRPWSRFLPKNFAQKDIRRPRVLALLTPQHQHSRYSSTSPTVTMTSTRPFQMDDLFRFNNVNLDVLTETYNMPFYLQYMSKSPELFTVATAPDGSITGYMLGKAEGSEKLWHGHVSAVTVAPLYRRLGLARTLMVDLESTSSNVYNAFFVDLFVRASNA